MDDPDGPKIIVTHKKPHLDEVVGAWLLRAFDPDFTNCPFQFISNTPTGGDMPAGQKFVGLGVGRGKYDEHGRQAGQSCTQLVYQDLLHRGLIPNEQHEDKALAWLVEYVHHEDTAHWLSTDPQLTSFMPPSILRGLWLIHQDDQVLMDKGLEIIDALMAQLNERARFDEDWDKRVEFDSIWGKAVGVHSTYRGSDIFAYHLGFQLRVQTDPTKPYGDFRVPAGSQIDLTPIYKKLIVLEPGAWYLHQTKKILVSNSDSTVGLPGTKFNLQQLIDFVKA